MTTKNYPLRYTQRRPVAPHPYGYRPPQAISLAPNHTIEWPSQLRILIYLKAAIQAMLPTLEENYWTQQATAYEESVIDREFRTIMDHALHPEDPDPKST